MIDFIMVECLKLRNKKTITVKRLQSFIGKLMFICGLVPAGRPFVSRMIALLKGYTNARPNHHLRTSKGFRADIEFWVTFLNNFQGSAFFLEVDPVTSADLKLGSDASNSGGGIFL